MTPLLKTDIFNDSHNLTETYIKDESANPTGTIKDRRNKNIISEANRLKVDKLVLITAGSNGLSLATLAQGIPIKVVCIVEKEIDPTIMHRLCQVTHQVIPLNLNEKILRTEEIIAFARERDDEVIWDVTNGYEDNYFPVVKEIIQEIPRPDYIVTPLGSGGIFVGVVNAMQQFKLDSKVIGIGPQSVQKSLADKLHTPWSPYTRAIENYKKYGHEVYRLDESRIRNVYQRYQHIADVEPSSAIVFAAPILHQFKPEDTIVFINFGKTNWA